MDGLQAGWAQREITPTLGIHMGGYWGRRSGATEINDPCTPALSCGETHWPPLFSSAWTSSLLLRSG